MLVILKKNITMFYQILILYLFYITILIPTTFSNSNSLLLIISFDGFRFDYSERGFSNNLVNLKINSSYSSFMISVFPTKTFPNHFSIATGLYTEVHGVLDNQIFDQTLNKTLRYGYDLFHYNDEVVPLWILNERGGQGRRSGCMMWPGSDFKYQDTSPSRLLPYNISVPWEDRVDILLSWFSDPVTPVNLVMAYFEQPDLICHQFGPDSAKVNEEISRVDHIVSYLRKKADLVGILDRLNIVFLSDHGGQAVAVPQNLIDLNNFVDKSWYKYSGIPPNLQIYPVKDKEVEVVQALKNARNKTGGNFSTFTREEMLTRWHYKHCNRTPPVLVVADLGYFFQTPGRNYTVTSSVIGTHGYDPQEWSMRAFFMAMGPVFKQNYTVKPFENIHIYPLAAHILGLPLPALQPNGSLLYLQDILASPPVFEGGSSGTAYLVAGTLFVVVCILIPLVWLFFRKSLPNTRLGESSSASYN